MSAVEFSSSQFLRDLETTAGLLGAPYSQPMAHRVLHAFEESFHRGAVLWRTTDKLDGALNYRLYERVSVDTMRIAERAGFLALPSPSARLISAWSALYDDSRELCEFDSATGLVKTLVYLEGRRPLAEVLSPPEVPDAVRRHEGGFHELGLDLVRNVAVDYRHGTANLYFHTHEGISPKAAERLLNLSESAVPDEATYQDMAAFIAPDGYTFSVTLRIDTGDVERVGFYALRLPAGQFPRIGDRLGAFFDRAPSHDEEEMNAVAWFFGSGTSRHLNAERGYCGRLVDLMRECAGPMTAPQTM